MKTDYDVIIAGAGIIGLAAAFKLTGQKPGLRLLVLEKENGPAKHQTGNNSGVIHSGIYYKPGSLKAVNCIRGYKELLMFCDKESIAYEICGKIITAVNESELPRLYDIYDRGIKNGLSRIRLIDKDELNEIEPHTNGIKAIHVPYTGIIDFRKVALKLAEKIGNIEYNSKVISVKILNGYTEIITENRSFKTNIFVNCCGLFSDDVAAMAVSGLDTRIIPFRGEYYKLKPGKRYLVRNLIYPVPDPEFPFLGVHFTRTTDGDIEAGPNAVLSFKKEGYSRTSFSMRDTFRTFTWKGFLRIGTKYFKTGIGEFYRSFSRQAFVKALQKLVPEIRAGDLIPGGIGVRAQAVSRSGKLVDDFLILEKGNIINVLNAPSPAATSSFSIGQTISEIVFKKLQHKLQN